MWLSDRPAYTDPGLARGGIHHDTVQPGRDRGIAVNAGGAVGLLPEDVRVSDVPSGFFDHVDVDPSQADLAHVRLWHRFIESESCRCLSRLLAGSLVFLDQRADCFVLRQVPAFVATPDIGTD